MFGLFINVLLLGNSISRSIKRTCRQPDREIVVPNTYGYGRWQINRSAA